MEILDFQVYEAADGSTTPVVTLGSYEDQGYEHGEYKKDHEHGPHCGCTTTTTVPETTTTYATTTTTEATTTTTTPETSTTPSTTTTESTTSTSTTTTPETTPTTHKGTTTTEVPVIPELPRTGPGEYLGALFVTGSVLVAGGLRMARRRSRA